MTFETLRHHWELRQQLEKHENLLCELRHSAQATSHAPDGMPRTKGVSDKVGTLAIVIVDLEERIAYLKKTIAAEEGDISAWISGIEDPLVRQIFRLRFLCGLSWADVAQTVGGRNSDSGVRTACYRYINRQCIKQLSDRLVQPPCMRRIPAGSLAAAGSAEQKGTVNTLPVSERGHRAQRAPSYRDKNALFRYDCPTERQ